MSTPDEVWKDVQQFRQKQAVRDSTRYGLIKHAGETMSQLTADPNWEYYGRFLEGQRDLHKQQQARFEAKLTGAYLKPEEYGDAKFWQAYHKGWVDSLEFALSLAKTLIEDGAQAAENLNNLTNKGEQL